MRPTTRHWLDGLRATAAELRSSRPSPVPAPASAAFVAERTILGAHLATALAAIDSLLAARRASAGGPRDPDPVLVLSTSPAGLAAAHDLLDPDGGPFAGLHGRLEPVTELEYRRWCMRSPDGGFHAHVNLWNWVKTRVPGRRHAEFGRHPLGPGEAYWLHRAGVAGAGAADRSASHLWKWNGGHASLLETFVTEAVGGRAAPADR